MIEALDYGSWGRVFAPRQEVLGMRDRTAPLPRVKGSLLPHGAGRSYGDSCLNDGQSLIRARDLDRFIAFDPRSGVLRCEAGVLLGEILAFAVPRGWFLAVTPGTQYVTVGGAIANDVHGKNHHRDGSFGNHVEGFELLRSDGSRRFCTGAENTDLFAATVGGLGLTGLITWATIRLRRVAGGWVRQRTHRFRSLEEFFAFCEPLEREHQYVVAWLDCLAPDARSTRGLLFGGDHDDTPGLARARVPLSVPVQPPVSMVNGFTLRAFNALYYRITGRRAGAYERVPYEVFFYPLDRIRGWNRMYGPRGFYQYQCVVPDGPAGREALAEMLARIAAARQGSFLAVLKRFGSVPAAGMLSFPTSGYTFALDFPNRGAPTLALLEQLDGVVVAAGGRVYPAKDARMSPRAFQAFYPAWRDFARHVDPAFSSSFWRRVTAVPPEAAAP